MSEYVTIRDLPTGGKEADCTLCGQHLENDTTVPYTEALVDAEAERRFRLRHDDPWIDSDGQP